MKPESPRRGLELAHGLLRAYGRYAPRHRGKLRAIRGVWRVVTPPPYQRSGVLRQAPITVRCDLTQYIQWNLYFLGEYEPHECALWMRLAREARAIADAGANIGLYSLLAAYANPRAAIHAFEPTPRLCRELIANLEANNLRNVIPHELAIGSSSGTLFLHDVSAPGSDNEGTNYVSDQPDATTVPVTAVSMDDFCAQNGIDKIDLWKLDVEGGEYDALEGANGLLSEQRVGCVFLELINEQAVRGKSSTGSVRRLLIDHGYRLFRFSGRRLVPLAPSTRVDAENVVAASPPWVSLLPE